jgi:hypothetical protein
VIQPQRPSRAERLIDGAIRYSAYVFDQDELRGRQ